MSLKPDAPYDETALARDAENDIALPEEYDRRADLNERLQKIILGLSKNQRQTITLYYFSKLNISEITEIMDCPESAVMTRLALSRGSIMAEISELERKSGESFNKSAMLELKTIFNRQLKKQIPGKQRAAQIYKTIRKQTTDITDKENHHGKQNYYYKCNDQPGNQHLLRNVLHRNREDVPGGQAPEDGGSLDRGTQS